MIELNKEYRTNDDREVVIYTIDAGGDYPVHAGVVNPDTKEIKMQVYDLEGQTPTMEDDLDINWMFHREPRVNEVVLLSDPEDMLPVIALYQHTDEEGIWGMVDMGNDRLQPKCFGLMYSDIGELDEAVGAFIKDKEEAFLEEIQEQMQIPPVSQEQMDTLQEFAANLIGDNISLTLKKI